MKNTVWLLPFVLQMALAQDEEIFKRAVQYVTVYQTTNIPLAQYLAQSPTQGSSPAVATPVTTSKSGGSLWSLLDSYFGDSNSVAATTPVATTPATTSAAYVPATTPIAAATSTKAVHWWDNLGNLFGDDSSSSIATTSPSYGSGSGAGSGAVSYTSTGGIVATKSSYGTSSKVYASATASSQASSGSSSSGNYGDYSGIVSYATKAKGVTYSPYTDSGSCKSAAQVAKDFENLRNFQLIRLYSTDCSGVENSLAAITLSQKMFLGIYNIDTNTITTGLQAIQSAVEATSRGWSAVDTISIGNEQVNDGKATVADIQTALSTARSWLKLNAPDFTGSVVTVDTLVAVKSNTGLCDLSDYLAVNCHPFWDGGVEPSNAGPWLMEQIASLQSACGNSKEVFITETGWPNKGSSYGSCVPSVANEESAFESIVGSTTNFLAFTMYNDPWKPAGSYGVELNWGIFGPSPE